MPLARSLRRRRNRAVWRDPARTRRTLESFAATEEDGGRDLVAAARRASDPELALHLRRHARDELRHAELFRGRAARVVAPEAGEERPDRPYDLSRGRRAGELDAHGFLTAGLIDELGEVEYVAMLHVAEGRAADLFTLHAELCEHDPETRAIFEEILRDEKYHVAYTARFLDRWRAEGRAREVDRALRAARGSRLFGAWKRLGARSGAGFSRLVLRVLYWTVLAPFGLLAARRPGAAGGRPARPARASASQY